MSVERKWTAEEIAKDDVSKKDIIAFLHGSYTFWMVEKEPEVTWEMTECLTERPEHPERPRTEY